MSLIVLGDFAHDGVADVGGALKSGHDELLFGASTLHLNGAEAENGMEETGDVGGHVLHTRERNTRDFAAEVAGLLNINDTSRGDDPLIQEEARECAEEFKPCEEPPRAKDEAHPFIVESEVFGEIVSCAKGAARDVIEKKNRQPCDEGVGDGIPNENEPMLPHHKDDFLARFKLKFWSGIKHRLVETARYEKKEVHGHKKVRHYRRKRNP